MSGLEAREIMEAAVRRELFGPSPDHAPEGQPLDTSRGVITFTKREQSYGQFHDLSTGQEILTQSDPLRRYGVGVLFNGAQQHRSAEKTETSDPVEADIDWIPGLPSNEVLLEAPPIEVRGVLHDDHADTDDFDLSDANTFKPSAMAVSFKCRLASNSSFNVTVTGAYYDKILAHIPGLKEPRAWWARRPFVLSGTLQAETLLNDVYRLKVVNTTPRDGKPRISPTIQVFSRPVPHESDADLRLVTLAVVNQSTGTGASAALFQMGFTVTPNEDVRIEPYQDAEHRDRDEEEESIDLLYRNQRTYAIGHGCSADWGPVTDESTSWVSAVALPAYEVVSLTPNVYTTTDTGERHPVTVSMAELAAGSDLGSRQVETVLTMYADWISEQEALIPDLLPQFHAAAHRHMELCRDALTRMQQGWELVRLEPVAREAFQLANEAMRQQQVRSRLPLREVEVGPDDILHPVGPTPTPGPATGAWRPFQLAFILASLPELINPSSEQRNLVDLIFFPTGGGKTEAYLGASAISLLARRLRDPQDVGTDTLMRYTLRLLTAQQFLRAASLICVLEDIRSQNERTLGKGRFGIGIWLGGSSTPNTWKAALSALTALRRHADAENKFLLLRCPWCATRMGTIPKAKSGQHILGYEQVGNRIVLRCVDSECRFSGRKGLPVHVVDEDIYETRPSIVIGTVDKFAMMAWRPQARNLFGIGQDGKRDASPPSLIIQDELHLISGPLGSMVGLYEPIIDDLCTDRRLNPPIPAKIIAATATVRRYQDQVRGLFGREKVALFPPHGLEEGHSFFAEPATRPDGSFQPGRRYLGVMSAALGSLQTVQVRVASATLQGATAIAEDDRDGYWTNLNFLNSLRELGNTVSLLQSDVPDYLTGLRRRDGITPRWPRSTMELTSRRRSDEIPQAIEQLQVQYGDRNCVDICLASNIIEVGIDIDRLGLMTVVGQPKTTAQYIQVSGRVGRRADVSPGLVITLYVAAKPRDRSHYERFRAYHQRLYAQVEPTSVTPFATPVLRRALHAAAVAHIRQLNPSTAPYPFPVVEFNEAISVLKERAEIVDQDEVPTLERLARERATQWDRWERTAWEANVIGGDPKQGLMRFAGTLPDLDSKATVWDVPTSMRSVDAECKLQVTLAYSLEDGAGGSDER